MLLYVKLSHTIINEKNQQGLDNFQEESLGWIASEIIYFKVFCPLNGPVIIIFIFYICLSLLGGNFPERLFSYGGIRSAISWAEEPQPSVPTQDPDATIKEGRRLIREAGCRGCHVIEGYGASHAPSLDWKGKRYTEGWLKQYISNPYRMRPYIDSLMPDYTSSMAHRPLSEGEIDVIVSYFRLLATSGITDRGESTEPDEDGTCYSCHSEAYMKMWAPYKRTKIPEDVVKTIDSKPSLILCLSCHILGELGRKTLKPSKISSFRMAFDLIHSVKKNRIEWIIDYTRKKEHLNRKSGMPYLSLPTQVLENIRNVLTILKGRIRSKGPDRLEVVEEHYSMNQGERDVSKGSP